MFVFVLVFVFVRNQSKIPPCIFRDEEGLGLKDIAAEATGEMRNQVRRKIMRFESSTNSSYVLNIVQSSSAGL